MTEFQFTQHNLLNFGTRFVIPDILFRCNVWCIHGKKGSTYTSRNDFYNNVISRRTRACLVEKEARDPLALAANRTVATAAERSSNSSRIRFTDVCWMSQFGKASFYFRCDWDPPRAPTTTTIVRNNVRGSGSSAFVSRSTNCVDRDSGIIAVAWTECYAVGCVRCTRRFKNIPDARPLFETPILVSFLFRSCIRIIRKSKRNIRNRWKENTHVYNACYSYNAWAA